MTTTTETQTAPQTCAAIEARARQIRAAREAATTPGDVLRVRDEAQCIDVEAFRAARAEALRAMGEAAQELAEARADLAKLNAELEHLNAEARALRRAVETAEDAQARCGVHEAMRWGDIAPAAARAAEDRQRANAARAEAEAAWRAFIGTRYAPVREAAQKAEVRIRSALHAPVRFDRSIDCRERAETVLRNPEAVADKYAARVRNRIKEIMA